MTTSTNQDNKLEKLCSAAIDRRLGDISGLPLELMEYVSQVYREFIASYLNILRQRDNKPADWVPDSLIIEAEVSDGMRHFFSDYQHITREFYKLNQKMDRLQQIDQNSQQHLFQHAIDEILDFS